MEKIASFTVNHTNLNEGIYISRIDGDITTYDLRTRKPNTCSLMDHSTMHSMEHLFATMVRNSELKEDVIYFGPMGCQTGFYLLVRNARHEHVLAVIKQILAQIAAYTGEMPGNSAVECGNYTSLNVEAAKKEAKTYLQILQNKTAADMAYSN